MCNTLIYLVPLLTIFLVILLIKFYLDNRRENFKGGSCPCGTDITSKLIEKFCMDIER